MTKDACPHAKTERGKDVPLRYGSYRSEVCVECGAFRTRDHHDVVNVRWRPASEYEQATDEDEDE